MPSNYYMYFIVGLIPMVVGAIYYNPKVLGNAWMKVNGFTEESLQGGNMIKIFGLSYVLSVMVAFTLGSITIHQTQLFSLLAPDVLESGSAMQQKFNDLMSEHGTLYRTFKHGALHGTVLSIFLVLPLIGINALFERRGWIYIVIHWGYWAICLALMGGIICQTLQFAPLS